MSERFDGGAPMARWYHPRLLLSTAAKAITSGVLADYRAISALAGVWDNPFDYDKRTEMWLDYVADVGDGWSSTYGVARAMAAPALELEGESLGGGEVLVMGGDQVYPFATRERYKQRLRRPYETAYASRDEPVDLFVLPGNHDWYDGLVNFSRLFCQHRVLDKLRTRQDGSYFALRLPHNWWLLAFDIQLDVDMDQAQIEYFAKAAVNDFGEGDRVIVSTAVPGWVTEGESVSNNFRFIEREIEETGARIHLWLAGDLHCYMRHTEADGDHVCHKVIAGGGGAFLHPTHGPRFDATRPEARYPDPGRSRALSWGNLLFAVKNPAFGAILAVLFAVLGAAIGPSVAAVPAGLDHVRDALIAGTAGLFTSPFALLLAGVLFAGGVGFAGVRSAFGWIAGAILALAMLATAIVAAWVSYRAAAAWPPSTGRLLVAEAAFYTGVLGGALGLVVLGLFLTAANLAGQMLSHGFAAMRIEGYKNFVRLHIHDDGALDLYAIGLDDVPRRWLERGGDVVPDGDVSAPRLIEKVRIAGPTP